MLNHMRGNLLDIAEDGHFDCIVHGCNCLHIMGGGIALEIKNRYAEAYVADRECHKKIIGDGFDVIEKLGTYSIAETDKFDIINAYTQIGLSKNGEDVFEYRSFELILRKLAVRYPGKRFGLPMIGAGLAGGRWDIILQYIERFAEEVEKTGGSVTLVEFG